MALTNQQIVDRVRTNVTFGDGTATDNNTSDRAFGFLRTERVYMKAADALANSTETTWIHPVDRKIQVLSVTFLPNDTLTAHNTTFATLSLEVDDGAGGADTQIAVAYTNVAGTGNFTAGTAVNIPLSATATNAVVDGGTSTKWLIFKNAKASTGVVVPAGALCMTYKLVP